MRRGVCIEPQRCRPQLELAVHRQGQFRFNWRALVLASRLLLVAIGEFYIAPEIAGLSASQAVARLHGVASIACLITRVVGLILMIAGPDSD